MGKVKIPYYVVIKGRGYWRPNPRMWKYGFGIVRCGADGPEAWALAQSWNEKWQAVRRGDVPAPVDVSNLTRYQVEATIRYPAGTVGAAFQAYVRTDEWTNKALSTRMKIWWVSWFRIREIWGDVAPDSITFERKHGLSAAHKTLKVWRALWVVMRAMKIARGNDPSLGVRNRAPAPRYQRWSEGEAVRLVKVAWRAGYRGLACVIAIGWDTGFSPVDVRTLAERHRAAHGGRLIFDKQAEGRAKTGRPSFGTVSRRTERLVTTYLATLGVELHPDAILMREPASDI